MASAQETPQQPEWLKSMYPWTQKSLAVNGRRMAFLDEGKASAPPVLLLHGNPNWSFLYRFFVGPLVEAGYRVIAPDWIGAGYSDKPNWDSAYSLAHHIADLVSLLDQLDLHDLTVVGHDWGGPQGVGAALQRKDRVAALVLMNTWLFTDVLGPFHASPLPWTSWHAPLMGQVFMKRFKVLSRSGMFLASQRDITSAEIHGYVHPWDAPHSETVTLTWPRTIPLVEGDRGWADMKMIENRLPELHDVPVQLIWAPEDPVFTIDYAKRLQTLLPHAEEPILFERASHFLQDDRGPDIVRAIVAFLNRKIGARS